MHTLCIRKEVLCMLYLLYALFLLGGVLFVFTAGMLVRAVRNPSNRSLKNRVIPVALAILACTLSLRLAVELGAAFYAPQIGVDVPSNWFEILGDSLVHTMQTFSMDEDYTLYLLAGKQLLVEMGLPAAALVYGTCATLVHVAAPIAGGAILLDILCDFFPALRYGVHCSHTKYIFNELNDASILLAESIREKQRKELNGRRPSKNQRVGIVFANTTIDSEDEHENHLYTRALAIGAYCVTRDVCRFPARSALERFFRDTRNIIYILLSENQDDNLDTALRLRRNPEPGAHTAAVVFSDDPADGELLDQANQAESDMLLFLVQDHKNTVLRQMVDHPLFLPLLEGEYDALEVLVVGSGALAEEYICQSVWCGQLLRPSTGEKMPFTIHALAEGEREKQRLEQAVRHRMPAFFTDESGGIARIVFHSAAPGSAAFDSFLEQHCSQVSTAAVCLEDSSISRRTALVLKRWFDRRSLSCARPVNLLCYTPFRGIAHAFDTSGRKGCVIHPFGILEDRYSVRQVFLEDLLYYTVCMNNAYSQTDEDDRQEMKALLRSSYRLNSSMASAIHFSYKLFSAGVMQPSDDLSAEISRCADRFDTSDAALLDRMAWLEHLRWCAWVWQEGFRAPTPDERQRIVDACTDSFDHKSLALRLHPCLVATRPGSAFRRQPDLWDTITPGQLEELDELDQLSFLVDEMARSFYIGKGLPLQRPDGRPQRGLRTDFKEYDYRMVEALPGNLRYYAQNRRTQNPDLTLALLLDRL